MEHDYSHRKDSTQPAAGDDDGASLEAGASIGGAVDAERANALALDNPPQHIGHQLDSVLAYDFSEHVAARFADMLSSYLTPVSAEGWQHILRTKLPEDARTLRSEVHDRLSELENLNTQIKDGLASEDTSLIAQCVRSDLNNYLLRCADLIERLRDFNTRVYGHAVDLQKNKIRRYLKQTNQLSGYTPDEIDKRAREAIGVTKEQYVDMLYGSLIDTVNLYQVSNMPAHIDLNDEVSRYTHRGIFEISYDQNCSTTLANSAYVRLIINAAIREFGESYTQMRKEALTQLSDGNALYHVLLDNRFRETKEGRLVSELLAKPDTIKVQITSSGEISFRLAIPGELEDFAGQQCATLSDKLSPLQEAIGLSGSALKVDYSPGWGELTAELVFRVTHNHESESHAQGKKKSSLFNRSLQDYLDHEDGFGNVEIQRQASIGQQSREYKVRFHHSLLAKHSLREALTRIMDRADKFMICLPRFDHLHVEHRTIQKRNTREDQHDDQPQLRIYFSGHTDSQGDIQSEETSDNFASLVETSFSWEIENVSDWKDSIEKPREDKEDEVDRVLQFVLDESTIFDEELGDLIAELESKADILFCELVEDLYADMAEDPDADTQRMMVAAFEGILGLVDDLTKQYPDQRFRIFLPALRRRNVIMDTGGESSSVDKAFLHINIHDEEDMPLVTGHFKPQTQSFFYFKRDTERENRLVDAVLECMGNIDPDKSHRGSQFIYELEKKKIRLPLSMIQRFIQEDGLEQYFEPNDEVDEEQVGLPLKRVREELRHLVSLPTVFVGEDEDGFLHMRVRSSDEYKKAERIGP